MFKNVFNAKIPLVVVIILFAVLVIGFCVFAVFFREKISYSLFLGDTSLSPAEFEFGPAPAFGNFDFFSDVK